jgi:hypothetical protein
MINTLDNTPVSLNSQDVPPTSLYGRYFCQTGQSVYDVCLQLYGTLDELLNLIVQNNFSGLNDTQIQGRQVIFELVKRQDSLLGKYNSQNNINYATIYIPAQPTPTNYELREDGGFELREDGGFEIRG